jgi:peptidyl-prolyl cis-trans isomerase D
VMEWMRRYASMIFLVLGVAFVGWLVVDTSGLLGMSAVTPTTAVATVNGDDILATRWYELIQRLEQQESEGGRTLSLDDRQRLADRAFEELVANTLLQQEFEHRNITVSDEEIRTAAQYSPPPDLLENPELQTEGRFDPAKYQRLLNSPAARRQGLLLQLEAYYKSEIPRQKLFDQIASTVYISDQQLFAFWQARRDSAQVSFARFDPDSVRDTEVSVSDDEIRRYYDTHKKNFERPARALVSVMVIPRVVSPADSAATRTRAVALREDIVSGRRTFEEVARTESADSGSAVNGGDLGRGPSGRFVDAFEQAAYALRPRTISEPVLSPFGYHLIRVDEKKGDTLAVRHILLRIEQSDSAATITDRRADSLSRIAGGADDPRKFDAASRTLGLPISRGVVIEGDQFTLAGRYVPGVAAWAVSGARKGEVSELLDWEEGYAIARLDSLVEGGTPKLAAIKDDIRRLLVRQKKLDRLVVVATPFAREAARTSLEAAARAHRMEVQQSEWFTRAAPAGELGRLNEAIGAAFSLPLRKVSAPIRTLDGVFVIRVDGRIVADRAEFEREKAQIRAEEIASLRQERVQQYLQSLRETAKIVDRRKEIAQAQRAVAQ